MTKNELQVAVRKVVDCVVKSVNPFTVFDITRLVQHFFDKNIDHDDVRKEVEEYFFESKSTLLPVNTGFAKGWGRTVGEHLPFANAAGHKPQIYHRSDFNIKAYDPDRLDPNKHNALFMMGLTKNPFVDHTSGVTFKSNKVNKASKSSKKSRTRTRVTVPAKNFAYAIKHKKLDLWRGGTHYTRSGKQVKNLSQAALWSNKNGPSQALNCISDRQNWEIKTYKLVEEV